jgi:MFS family permease
MPDTNTSPIRGRSNPLINRDMGLLWAAQGLSFLGDQIFDTTLVVWIGAVLAHGQPWAPLAVAGVFIAIAVPTLAIGPLAGVFVDRSDKRRMLLATDAVRAVLIAGLLGSTGIVGGFHPSLQIQLGSIYAVVFMTTAAAQFFGPARYALIRDVVPEAERPRATSLSQVNSSVSSIVGPPLAVPVLFVLGIQWALIADALSFALSFTLISLVKAPPAARSTDSGQTPSFFRELGDGLRFAATSQVARALLVSIFIVMLGAGALNALDIFFVIHNLSASPNLYGFLSAAMGIGVLAGAVLAGGAAGRLGLHRVFSMSLLTMGLLLLIYARMTTFIGAVIVLFLAGFPQAAVNVVAAPILLAAVPRALIGRVFALVQPIASIAGIISTAGAGYLATSVLPGLHAQFGSVRIGTYDTIFSLAGVLVLAGGVFAAMSLRPPARSQPQP